MDITLNLKDLQFNSSLEEDELKYLILRNRSHSLLVHGCAHACFLLKCLHDFRIIKNYISDQEHGKVSIRQLVQLKLSEKDPLLVGIIGAGRLGSYLADIFINTVQLLPEELKISTRRPELLRPLSDKGVTCVYDNARVASSVHILFICVSASQLPSVAKDLRGHLSPRTHLYAMTVGISQSKLSQLLDHENLIGPNIFTWNDELASDWSIARSVNETLQSPESLQQTSPFVTLLNDQESKSGVFISCESKLYTMWLYTLLNFCTLGKLTINQTLEAINCILLGVEDYSLALENDGLLIRADDIAQGLKNSTCLPIFTLIEISQRQTFFDERFAKEPKFCEALHNHYCSIFDNFYRHQNFG